MPTDCCSVQLIVAAWHVLDFLRSLYIAWDFVTVCVCVSMHVCTSLRAISSVNTFHFQFMALAINSTNEGGTRSKNASSVKEELGKAVLAGNVTYQV